VIVDLYGNPIESRSLAEPQSSDPRLAYLPREFAGHPSRGLTPARLAALLQRAETGEITDQAELWQDIREKWGHCDAEMGRRERALLTLDRRFVPPDDANRREKKAADYLNDIFDGHLSGIGIAGLDDDEQEPATLDSVIMGCADAMGHGFSAQEITWAHESGRWLSAAIEQRPPTWFRLDLETRTRLRLRDGSADGLRLRPGSWILHRHRARSGHLARIGLVRSLAWPYLFANYSIRDLAELLEIWGLPIRIGKHQGNATDLEKRKLLQAVLGIGRNAGGIIPNSMEIEIIQGTAAAGGDLFMGMVNWAEATASKIITGQHYQGGKTATESKERNEVKWDLTTADARQIDQTLTAFGWLILTMNPEGAGIDRLRCPRHKFDTADSADISALAESLPKLVAVGGRFSRQWLNEVTKIPAPDDDEDALAPMVVPEKPVVDTTSAKNVNPQPQPAATKAALAAGTATAERTPVSAYAAQLAERAAGPLAEWEAVLRTKVEACRSPEDAAKLRDELPALFESLNSATLAGLYAEGLECAELAGRFDVSRGH
jgi:phage gp29-like protein